LRLQARETLLRDAVVGSDSPRFGQPQTVLTRLGQGAFRVIVTDVYKRQCAVTNSHVLYLTVTPDYHVEVSHRLKDEFDNGKEYYALQGRNIVLPESPVFRPSAEQLTWHNENVYRP